MTFGITYIVCAVPVACMTASYAYSYLYMAHPTQNPSPFCKKNTQGRSLLDVFHQVRWKEWPCVFKGLEFVYVCVLVGV